MVKNIGQISIATAMLSVGMTVCTPPPRPAPPLTINQEIPIQWVTQCIDGDFTIVCDQDFDNMSINATPEAVTLTNDPDPNWQEGEYRNAFTLSQALNIQQGGEILVIKGRLNTQSVVGTTGLWVHLDGIFDENGQLLTDGFVGGAAGFSYSGSLNAPNLQGWAYQQVEGWFPNFFCSSWNVNIVNNDNLELRITNETTQFIINDTIVNECDTNYAAPDVVIQFWLDNYAVGPLFQIEVGDVTTNQVAAYSDLGVYYATLSE
jgi:hypothetical protein